MFRWVTGAKEETVSCCYHTLTGETCKLTHAPCICGCGVTKNQMMASSRVWTRPRNHRQGLPEAPPYTMLKNTNAVLLPVGSCGEDYGLVDMQFLWDIDA